MARTPRRASLNPREDVSAFGRIDSQQVLTPTGFLAVGLLWRRFAVFLGGVMVMFLAAETALGLMALYRPPVRKFQRRFPTPYLESYAEPDYHGDGVDTNSAGFRHGPLPKVKPPGETRVFFLSSSVGFRGRTNETTISGLMQQRLSAMFNQPGRRIRVINASGPSFVPRQSLVLLVTRILDYEPDIIVFFQGPEALYYPAAVESRPGYPFSFVGRELKQPQRDGLRIGPNPLLAWIMRTRTMRLFQPDLMRKRAQSKLSRANHVVNIDSLEDYDPYIECVVQDVRKIVRIAGAYGCRTLVAVPPWRDPTLLPGALPRLVNRLRTEIKETGGGAGFVDTTRIEPELTARQLWEPDMVHWSDEGNALFADKLVQSLLENGLLRKPPVPLQAKARPHAGIAPSVVR